ncbi:putative deacetylase LmbE-like domain-containing protein [Phyllosticta paracitricarpa]|uniref:N-acetylglucosaminylphosphatidylinositol deacetylase n=1 Tax=Phyllosticta paracitricarpa TaxID=2016321 RepID=A0ABR1MVX0_9PEZI
MNWLLWASLPLLALSVWMYTMQLSKSLPTLRNKKICLLIAHPDDEAMFFAPTVQALAKPELGNHIKILCLSSGDADGLGETRKKELVKSGTILGLKSEEDVLVIEDTNFPDSMSVTWNPRLISNLLTKAFAPRVASLPNTSAPEATIDVLITFDAQGISGHPNHRSLYHGAHAFLKALMHRHAGWECPIKLYTLTTVNIMRKYASVLDSPATVGSILLQRKQTGSFPSPLLFASGPSDVATAQTAMTKAHASQMVWFRWGWITIGRYLVVNDLRREKEP